MGRALLAFSVRVIYVASSFEQSFTPHLRSADLYAFYSHKTINRVGGERGAQSWPRIMPMKNEGIDCMKRRHATVRHPSGCGLTDKARAQR